MIDRFAQQLWKDIGERMQHARDGSGMSQSHFRALLESSLRKCRLVTREEFDAQQAVLARTREKLEALEQRLEALSTAPDSGPAKSASGTGGPGGTVAGSGAAGSADGNTSGPEGAEEPPRP